MIEKMRFITVMGPFEQLDAIIERHISRYEIQMADILQSLGNRKGLHAIEEVNPYQAPFQQIAQIADIVNVVPTVSQEISLEDALRQTEALFQFTKDTREKLETLQQQKELILKQLAELKHFHSVNVPVEKLYSWKYISLRTGRLPRTSYMQLKPRLVEESEMIFISTDKDEDYVWGVYFCPITMMKKIEAFFSSMHFEEIDLRNSVEGTPGEIYQKLSKQVENIDRYIEGNRKKQAEVLSDQKRQIAACYQTIQNKYTCFELRKYAVVTNRNFFIIGGWMKDNDAKKVEKELEGNEEIFIVEENTAMYSQYLSPPTKLKNNPLVKPFEFFVKMYGIPAYHEMDPTPFVALTYILLFGMMFGDVGQGIVISIAGMILYRKKGYALGQIMSVLGISAAAFGVLYGSAFGYEFEALWLKPMEDVNIQLGMYQILVFTICMGSVLILIAMAIHIKNALMRKELGEALFDVNGASGMVFYGSIILLAAQKLFVFSVLPDWILLTLIVGALILIALKEPLSELIKHKKMKTVPVSQFVMETFFELFEVILSYLSNTISFVRVGAFALSHAGMMHVILTMAENMGPVGKALVLVLGNIIVIGFEGLIVGIQVLRLEFYEMFSRYYSGSGHEFAPYQQQL